MGRKNKNKRMKKKANGGVAMVDKPLDTTTTFNSIPRSIEHTPEPTALVTTTPPLPLAYKTRLVLTQGRKDLKNAQPPFSFLFNPLRSIVLDPSMALASIVVPGIVSAVPVPMVDSITATSLKIPMEVAKFTYSLLPFRKDAKQIDLALVAQNDVLAVTSAGSSPLPLPHPKNLQSMIQAMFAFGVSAAADVTTAVLHPNKATTWMVTLWQVLCFLDACQLDYNLQESIVKPLYSGRLIDNINIYRKIQETPQQRIHRVKRFRHSQVQSFVNVGSRMMKYATAAYGTGMIASATNISTKQLDTVKSVIAKHVGIKKSDVKVLCVSEGGNMKLLRHFVAVDRKSRHVVLAIRGTLSVSGALIDVNAQDVDFLSGKAHKSMSEMATNLWNAVGGEIQELLAQLDNDNHTSTSQPWGLVITGHSLGGGVAALLNLKIHVENLLGSTVVKCFGFASPPVFYLDEKERDSVTAHAIDKAIKNCTCFIQGDDCVPFLSVVSVSKLAAQLETVDDATKTMWPLDRMSLASGSNMEIPQDLCDAVHEVEQPVVPGASRLTIPAEKIVWTFPSEGGGSFDVIGCLADELANLSIHLSADMITHHMPKNYEDALDALAK